MVFAQHRGRRGVSLVRPGLPEGPPGDHPGHVGSFDRGARASARVQLEVCLAEGSPGQPVSHHAVPLRRVFRRRRGAAAP